MDRYIFVTGGAGFIGSHIVDRLLEDGKKVKVIDNLSNTSERNIQLDVDIFPTDIRNRDEVIKLFSQYKGRIEAVMHLAAHIDVPESVKDPVTDAMVNVSGTFNVLDASRRAEVPRIVYASSYCIYGTPESMPVTEATQPHPESPYGLHKLLAEIALTNADDIEVFAVRAGNIFGPGQKISGKGDGAIIPVFFKKIVSRESPMLRGQGKSLRDYTYIDDAVDFFTAGLTAPPGVYNLGTGKGTSVQEVWDAVSDACRKYQYPIPHPQYQDLIPGEISEITISADKARNTFGWEPKVSFRSGVEHCVDYFLRGLKN